MENRPTSSQVPGVVFSCFPPSKCLKLFQKTTFSPTFEKNLCFIITFFVFFLRVVVFYYNFAAETTKNDKDMKAQKTKQASETTLIKIIVNLKCLGFPGRCLRSFTAKEKNEIFDEIIRRGWVDDNLQPLPAAADIIRQNLALCER